MPTNRTGRQKDWLIQPSKGARSYSPVPLFLTLSAGIILFQRALKTITAISPLLKNMFMDDEAYGVSAQKPLPRCKQDKNYSEREKNNNVPL